MTTPCTKPGNTRAVLTGLMAANPQAGQRHRLAICCRGAQCGLLCERLVKGPGKAAVYCVDVVANTRIALYPALADPAFVCPEGRF
jgi:hypothetical protein